jgi:hypothetical protein
VRQSKRVNQVVHLRLKSIYKAFQQSNNNNKNSSTSNFIAAATSKSSSASTSKKRGVAGLIPSDLTNNNNDNTASDTNPFHFAVTKDNTNNSTDYYSSITESATTTTANSDWGAFFGGDFCRPASTNTYNSNKITKEYTSCDTNITASSDSKGRYYGDRARMMMSVKAACAQAAGAAKNSFMANSNNKSIKGCDCNTSVSMASNATGCTANTNNPIINNNSNSNNHPNIYDYMSNSNITAYSRTDAEADAAAAALLKELEEEEEAKIVQNSKKTANKSKKKKQQSKAVISNKTSNTSDNKQITGGDSCIPGEGGGIKSANSSTPSAPNEDRMPQQQQHTTNDTSTKEKGNDDDEDSVHEMERTLISFIDSSDMDGIEAFLASIKGVPGRALLRKNAKKALKRIKEEISVRGGESHFSTTNMLPTTLPSTINCNDDDKPITTSSCTSSPTVEVISSKQSIDNNNNNKVKRAASEESAVKTAIVNATSTTSNAVSTSSKLTLPGASSNKASATTSSINRPLLKVVKQTTITTNSNSNSQSPFNNPSNNKQNQYQQQGGRAECVMHMSPVIIGWVIGKGGQRIRDIMEEASARIWIDQSENNIQVDGYRVVYVSGGKKNVETAIKLLKDLISKAPINNNNNNSNFESIKAPTASVSSAAAASDNSKGINNKSAGSSASVTTSSTIVTPSTTTSAWGKATNPAVFASKTMQVAQPEETGRSTIVTASSLASFTAGGTTETAVEYTQVVQCEPRFVALLIGRRGWTVKHIQDESGARVDIDQTVTPRIIRISGCSESQVTMATQMVRDVLSYPDAQLHYGESSVSKEKIMHRLLDQQDYHSTIASTANEEQQHLLASLEQQSRSSQAAEITVKASFDSLLPPLPTDAHHQRQIVGVLGKQHQQYESDTESSSSSFQRSISRQTSSSFLHHAPPPGYGVTPAVSTNGPSTPSSVTNMPLTPDAMRLERDMRSTTQSVLAGLYSPSDDEKRNSIPAISTNVDASWPQSALADISINSTNSFVTPSPLFIAHDKQHAISSRGEHDTGTTHVGASSMWSSQVGSSSSYLGLSESHQHNPRSLVGSSSPFYEAAPSNLTSSYQQQQSSLSIQQQPSSGTNTNARNYSRMMELFSSPANTAITAPECDDIARSMSLKNSINYSGTNVILTNPTLNHSSSSAWKSNNTSSTGSAFSAVSVNRGTSTQSDHLWSSREPEESLSTTSPAGSSSQAPFSSGITSTMNNKKLNFQSLPAFYSHSTQDGSFPTDESIIFPSKNPPPATRSVNSSIGGFDTSGLQHFSVDISGAAVVSHNPLWSRGFSHASSKSHIEESDTSGSKNDKCAHW